MAFFEVIVSFIKTEIKHKEQYTKWKMFIFNRSWWHIKEIKCCNIFMTYARIYPFWKLQVFNWNDLLEKAEFDKKKKKRNMLEITSKNCFERSHLSRHAERKYITTIKQLNISPTLLKMTKEKKLIKQFAQWSRFSSYLKHQ